MNKNGILLEVVQVLSDLDLTILKAYITSDGGWFMDGNQTTPFPAYKAIYSTINLTSIFLM